MHLLNTPIYYAKYKKEKSQVKALVELIKYGVAEVTTREEKKTWSWGRVGTLLRRWANTGERKHQDGTSIP